jgi:uncharacterized protein (TIGR03084 family)
LKGRFLAMVDDQDIYSDLVREGEEVYALVSGLAEGEWRTQTPAPGWTVEHQIAHLAFVTHLAAISASRPEQFRAHASAAGADFAGAINAALEIYMAKPAKQVLEDWRSELERAASDLRAVPEGGMVPWLVTPLPPAVLAAAGMMECFAHGQDVADALGIDRVYTDRVRHLVAFGVRTRDFGYQAHGLSAPEQQFRYELTGPSGAQWAFGSEDAENRVSGSAVDFCMLVTRRRHRADLALTAEGREADRWMDIAQAYRGPAGPGREPGQFDRGDHAA